MRREFLVALRLTAVTLVLTGLLYPLAVTGAAQLLWSDRANGSLVHDRRGAVVGSSLIGQPFAAPAYLQGRPSAAGAGYDATASSGSNLGPTSRALRDRAAAEAARLRRANPEAPGPIPAELVTASASGLDPDLSPRAALWQAPRIARARGVAPGRVRDVIAARVTGRDLGVFGEPRVDVLGVNLALDETFGRPTMPAPGAASAAAR